MAARFWLERHAAFRELGTALQNSAEDFRYGSTSDEDFLAPLARRLQLFLGELNGHHQVEDHHDFPVFRQAEPRLAAGFEVLDRDHQTLHAGLLRHLDDEEDLVIPLLIERGEMG